MIKKKNAITKNNKKQQQQQKVFELHNLRNWSVGHHKDVSGGEAAKAKGYAEHLFAILNQQRVDIAGFTQSM